MTEEDQTIETLLLLDGTRYVIDEILGLWVKFEAKKVSPTTDRPHGIRYSLTLHDRTNERIIGFDNAHAIEYGGKQNVARLAELSIIGIEMRKMMVVHTDIKMLGNC